MADRYRFWCHGVDVKVQFTKEYPPTSYPETEPDAGTPRVIVRNSRGTIVRQDGNGRGGRTSNWFHFGIPTPLQLADQRAWAITAYLKGDINGQATVQMVHIYAGGAPHPGRIHESSRLSLSARTLDESFDLPGERFRCDEPLVMCVKVLFEDGGEIRFAGAGVKFEAHEIWRG
jgi:hypothetical protein